MDTWTRRRVAVALLAIAAALVATGFRTAEASPRWIDTVGADRPAAVVAVTDVAVVVEYLDGGVLTRGVDRLEGGGGFIVGDEVTIAVRRDIGGRVLIEGAHPRWVPWYLFVMLLGGAAFVAGCWLLIRDRTVLPTLPRYRWISERHGGA